MKHGRKVRTLMDGGYIGMKNEISMPIELLISLLAQHYPTVNLSITFLMIDGLGDKLKSLIFEKIFVVNLRFQQVNN